MSDEQIRFARASEEERMLAAAEASKERREKARKEREEKEKRAKVEAEKREEAEKKAKEEEALKNLELMQKAAENSKERRGIGSG